MNYEVVSEDGQKLTVHRIPGPKGEKPVEAIMNHTR
jgi:hypothetical protein